MVNQGVLNLIDKAYKYTPTHGHRTPCHTLQPDDRLMKFLPVFKQHSKIFWLLIGFVLIAIIGILDYLTGYELAFSLFYLLPISLTVWYASRNIGIFISLLSTAVLHYTDVAVGLLHSHELIYFWNSLIRLGIFLIVVYLLSALKNALAREKVLARTDYLTGAVNSRCFFDLLEIEINLAKRFRRPLTLVYLDLDNFKTINDQMGHAEGNLVLCTTVDYIKKHLRKTDIVARIGGDEFAILLSGTDQALSRVLMSTIQQGLLDEMQKSLWPVTFSIGVLTITDNKQNLSSNQLIKMVDRLMYTVKQEGKNSIKFNNHSLA